MSYQQSTADVPAPVETSEEIREPVSDNDSEPYPDDDITEDEDDDEDDGEEDDMDDGDYKVNSVFLQIRVE